MKFGIALLLASLWLAIAAPAVGEGAFDFEKDYDDLISAEQTAAKRAARTRQIRPLVACADPGNMPLSNRAGHGIDNRIAKLVARRMNTEMSFFWRPYVERGLNRETFDNKECDLLLGMPEDYPDILTTTPIYRTTYVFAYRQDRGIDIKSLDDPLLKNLRIGVYQHSGLREALARHGIKENLAIRYIAYNTDLVPENQQWRQVQRVVDGELDVAGVWGPFAGFVKAKKDAPLVLQPVNVMEDLVPLEFSLTIGMRENDVVLKYALDNALLALEDEISAILTEFGMPLVKCSDCVVQGDLPSHGSYYKSFMEAARKRYLEPLDEDLGLDKSQATADQIVTQKRLEKWLQAGANVNEEFANAVLAADPPRIKFLAARGANVNQRNDMGYAPLHDAASNRDSATLELLLDLGADVNARDDSGWTPLMHAVFRNHVPSVKLLASRGARLEATNPEGFTALGIALAERSFLAARTLMNAGASPDKPSGSERMTPLMLVATHEKSSARESYQVDQDVYLSDGIEPIEIAELLVDKGANVNARTKDGVTAVMIAAGYDNSPMIGLLAQAGAELNARSDSGKTALDVARDSLSEAAIKTLKLFESIAPEQSSRHAQEERLL